MWSKPRLRTYRLVKEQLRHEKYLDCTEGDKRKALIELRSGANDLEVDKGRREKKELKDRICEECRGAVEDEIHLLLECPRHVATRGEMFRTLQRCGVEVEEAEGREARWKKVMWGKSKGHWRIVGKYAARMVREEGGARCGDVNLICTNDCALTCNSS